jgi:FkbM family methyltransferase
MFTVLRRAPKLAPFWALSKFYSLLGIPSTLRFLTRIIPSEFYDVRRVDGIRFGVRLSRPDDYQIVYGEQERAFLDLKPRDGDFVLDVGAHIGSYALRYSHLVGKGGTVLAFEPEPNNYRILTWNLQLNHIQNVEIRQEALGNFHGKSRLRISAHAGVHSFVRSSDEINQTGERVVSVVRLDDLDLDRLDLIKIDVEGFEVEVLKGGENTLRRFKPRMQIEVHQPHTPECETCNWLRDIHFNPAIIVDAGGAHWIRIDQSPRNQLH